jgi:hypothetical protein
MEDIHTLPFANLPNLNPSDVVLDTDAAAPLPVTEPERTLARKWRFALTNDASGGWGPAATEWRALRAVNANLSGRARVTVTDISATLRQVTVNVTLEGQPTGAQLVTLISRL